MSQKFNAVRATQHGFAVNVYLNEKNEQVSLYFLKLTKEGQHYFMAKFGTLKSDGEKWSVEFEDQPYWLERTDLELMRGKITEMLAST